MKIFFNLQSYLVLSVFTFTVLIASTSFASAANVTLEWDAPTTFTDGSSFNPSIDLEKYKVYYGKESLVYQSVKDAGSSASIELSDLEPGTEYFVSVTALAKNGQESLFASEFSFRTGGDGSIDSDGDGVSDDAEKDAGTDPLDPGSYPDIPTKRSCAPYNSNFGMLNFLEVKNVASEPRVVELTRVNFQGEVKGELRVSIAPGQVDVNVANLPGHQASEFGQICISHDGNPSDIDTHISHYFVKPGTSNVQYALNVRSSLGLVGQQRVAFNNYQPSQVAADSSNPVLNWISISRPYLEETTASNSSERGRLYFYDATGASLGNPDGIILDVGNGQRIDISSIEFGDTYGTAVWIPESSFASFSVRNTRYFPDNASGQLSFATAFVTEGIRGSGQLLSAPFDTIQGSVVAEILVGTREELDIRLEVLAENGELIEVVDFPSWLFVKNGSFHLPLDTIAFRTRGSIRAQARTKDGQIARGSTSLLVTSYTRSEDGAVENIYAIAARESLGNRSEGSFNSFIGHSTNVLAVNEQEDAREMLLEILASNGDVILAETPYVIPAKGSAVINLDSILPSDSYGRISVGATGGLNLWTLRQRGFDYIIPIRLTTSSE